MNIYINEDEWHAWSLLSGRFIISNQLMMANQSINQLGLMIEFFQLFFFQHSGEKSWKDCYKIGKSCVTESDPKQQL